jgi:hypothetical protein
VFTLPAAIADIAYQNKAVIYDLLFKASAETLVTIAADPKHLGARIGVLSAGRTAAVLRQSRFTCRCAGVRRVSGTPAEDRIADIAVLNPRTEREAKPRQRRQ